MPERTIQLDRAITGAPLPLRWSSLDPTAAGLGMTAGRDDGWFWATISGLCRRLSFDVLHNSKLCVAEVEFAISKNFCPQATVFLEKFFRP